MRSFLVMFLLFLPLLSFAQRAEHVILGDTIFAGGIIDFIYGSAELKYRKSRRDSIRTYTAEEVSEFQLKSGARFLSKEITLNGEQGNAFLELLLKGPINLLWLNFQGDRRLFLEVDSLEALTEDNFRDLLVSYCLRCNYSISELQYLKLKRKSIGFIVGQHNKGKCPIVPFLSYGLSGHYSVNNFSLPHRFETHLMRTNSWTMGMFLMVPFWKLPGAHFLTDLRYEKNTYSKTLVSSPELDEDVVLTFSGLNSLVAVQYGKRTRGFYTYVLGGVEAKRIVTTSSTLYQAIKEEQIIRTNVLRNTMQLSPFVGYTFGAGINVFYNPKHYVAFELRTSQLFGNAKTAINTTSLSVRFNR